MEVGDSACSSSEAPKGLTLIKAQLYYIYKLPDEIYLYIKLRDTGYSIGDVCNGRRCGERVAIALGGA